jgi:hypothetical protein
VTWRKPQRRAAEGDGDEAPEDGLMKNGRSAGFEQTHDAG